MAKKLSKTRRLESAAFHEVYHNTPAVVTATMAKSGPKRAAKQKVAIALSKARAAGARIPKRPRGG